MQGPWDKGEDTQGYQSRMTPSALYRAAITAIDQHAVASQGGERFAALLSDLEKGKVDLGGVDAKTFFKMLWLNTKEGMFSDPIYGGNKDMAGWKMLGFPGARYIISSGSTATGTATISPLSVFAAGPLGTARDRHRGSEASFG